MGASMRAGYAPTNSYALAVFGSDLMYLGKDSFLVDVQPGLGAQFWLQPQAAKERAG